MVIRTIVTNGMLKPITPLPDHLPDGTELDVEIVSDRRGVSVVRHAEIDAWFAAVQRLDGLDTEDQVRFDAAIAEHNRIAKQPIED